MTDNVHILNTKYSQSFEVRMRCITSLFIYEFPDFYFSDFLTWIILMVVLTVRRLQGDWCSPARL